MEINYTAIFTVAFKNNPLISVSANGAIKDYLIVRRYYFIAIGSSSRTQLGRIEQPDWSVGGKQNHLVALSNYISSQGMECAKHVNLHGESTH